MGISSSNVVSAISCTVGRSHGHVLLPSKQDRQGVAEGLVQFSEERELADKKVIARFHSSRDTGEVRRRIDPWEEKCACVANAPLLPPQYVPRDTSIGNTLQSSYAQSSASCDLFQPAKAHYATSILFHIKVQIAVKDCRSILRAWL